MKWIPNLIFFTGFLDWINFPLVEFLDTTHRVDAEHWIVIHLLAWFLFSDWED